MTLNTMHPDSERTLNEHLLSDYPVRLITKRVFSLSEKQILQSRNQAPVGMSLQRHFKNSLRPPC
jgi:hypothetical protein